MCCFSEAVECGKTITRPLGVTGVAPTLRSHTFKFINNISPFYVYGSVHHNIFYEITNRCSYMQSILCLWFRAS